jgi:hypothetical protein
MDLEVLQGDVKRSGCPDHSTDVKTGACCEVDLGIQRDIVGVTL